jgi:hypothetical protein
MKKAHNGKTGQHVQEYVIILALVAMLGFGITVGMGNEILQLFESSNESMATGSSEKASAKPDRVSPPELLPETVLRPNRPDGQTPKVIPENISSFAFSSPNGDFRVSINPNTGLYDVLTGDGSETNTTAMEGATAQIEMSRQVSSVLEDVANSGRLPGNVHLSSAQKAALKNLAGAGYGLAGAQYWLATPAPQMKEEGLTPWNVTDPDISVFAWGMNEGEFDNMDPAMVAYVTQQYNEFKQAYRELEPLMADDPDLWHFVAPLVASVDSVTRNTFFKHPSFVGSNLSVLQMLEQGLGRPLYPDIQPTSITAVSLDEAPQFTYKVSKTMDAQAGTVLMPTLKMVADAFKQATSS